MHLCYDDPSGFLIARATRIKSHQSTKPQDHFCDIIREYLSEYAALPYRVVSVQYPLPLTSHFLCPSNIFDLHQQFGIPSPRVAYSSRRIQFEDMGNHGIHSIRIQSSHGRGSRVIRCDPADLGLNATYTMLRNIRYTRRVLMRKEVCT